ncbi:MAG: HEAT repeat domain-containing protein [Planctomycetales bacterium]|nr:HEAT repeat domain-containing protein [Planctomycetales bacterium]
MLKSNIRLFTQGPMPANHANVRECAILCSRSGKTLLCVSGATAVLVVFYCLAEWYAAYSPDTVRKYVGRETCATCHVDQMRSWHGSDHDRAMELATEESVLGNFDNAEFTRLGVTTRFFRREGKYFVNTEGPDGQLHDYEVKYTFGIRPLQQYMVEFPDGRVQVLRDSWDTAKQEWFYVAPPDVREERLEPDDPLHWTGIAQNWNTMCADCHSTNLQKNFDLASNTYQTTFSEIDVSCETCHGPGSLHVELAESRSLFWDRRHGYGLAQLKGGSAERQIETCAPCHSRRSAIHAGYHSGDRFTDAYDPSLLRAGLYHADGQILDEVYVYGSFLQSKMHSKGVRCTDCHNPHSLKLKFEGNRLCTQCHVPGKYDSPTHHHHTDAVATQCVSCHMPSQTYMEIDDRRDHSLRIPRPDLTVELGTPNACNGCHTKPEESPAWAAAQIRQWYGDKRPDDPHYARAIAAAQNGEAEGLELVPELLRRQAAPDIVRATVVDLLAGYGNEESDRLCREMLGDTSPLVRTAAIRALSPQSLQRLTSEVVEALRDPVRLVRLAAVRRLAEYSQQFSDADTRAVFDRAVAEYREAHELTLDRAGAHLNLAALSLALGRRGEAQASLRTAIRLEPYLSGTRDQLAQLMEQSAGDPEQIRQLREKEVELLLRDSKLLPDNPQPRYRRGMLLYLLERSDEARKAFEEACQVAPNSYDSWLALALLCETQQRWKQAAAALKEMERLRPGDPAVADILQRIVRARKTIGE